jgi:hypothetical protein
MFSSVPPLMILAPAMFALGVQIPATIIREVAMFTLVVDGSVQSCFRLFDGMLALLPVLGVRERCRNK